MIDTVTFVSGDRLGSQDVAVVNSSTLDHNTGRQRGLVFTVPADDKESRRAIGTQVDDEFKNFLLGKVPLGRVLYEQGALPWTEGAKSIVASADYLGGLKGLSDDDLADIRALVGWGQAYDPVDVTRLNIVKVAERPDGGGSVQAAARALSDHFVEETPQVVILPAAPHPSDLNPSNRDRIKYLGQQVGDQFPDSQIVMPVYPPLAMNYKAVGV